MISLSLASIVNGALRINEISDKGTSTVCDGNDWIELYNSGPDNVVLGDGYFLHDDKGINDENAFKLPPGTLVVGQYLLLCTKMRLSLSSGSDALVGIALDDPSSPNFGISGKDTITLVRQSSGVNAIISTVKLPNTQDDFDVTYAFNETTGEYAYTSTPTPGQPNILTPPMTTEEKNAEHIAKLKAQNDLGKEFFDMDERGFKVDGAMDDVMQLHVTMNDVEYDALMANKSFELYHTFESSRLTTVDGTEITSLNSPGKIRAKGQSTLFMAVCLGTPTSPFQLDFSAFDDTQTLFGTEKIYLRHHMGDMSFSRDYAYYRMLARFGLPHLRVRKVEFYINGERQGYYSLLEAADQEYVFARNFPKYDPNNFALYKIKSMSLECGAYPEKEMEKAKARLAGAEESTPPYSFQRGMHKPVIEELGLFAGEKCIYEFLDDIWEENYADTVLAYLRYNENCADMIMDEGLIDRDLGQKKWDKEMHEFIDNDFRADRKCTPECANSDFAEHADVDQLLKTFAFYAVSVIADSPLINGNNYYLAQSGEEANGGNGGWKILPYDFNAARTVFCHDKVCNTRMVHWSIVRPTCEALENNPIVGPLLTDPTLHAKYIEYVREFTDTVYGNETFIQELTDHQAAQDKYVRKDDWSFFGAFYSKELTTEASNWEEEIDRFPLLPTMKARAEDVRAQLAAIDAGTFPRGPHLGVNGDNEAWEYCPDWRAEEVNTTTCEQGCKYEGCDMPGWTVESYCDEEFGVCYHGDYDEQCRGLKDEEQYPGMEDTEDGRKTFCRFAQGIPVKAAECPAVGAVKTATPPALEATASKSFTLGTNLWISLALSLCALNFR